MTWTPDSPPPCPLCGTGLTERTEPDGGEEGGTLYAYRCPGCRWEDAGSYDYTRLTVATAPWTRDLWAEVERRQAALDELTRWARSGPRGCPPYTSSVAHVLTRLDESFAALRSVEEMLRAGRDEAERERDEARRDLARIVQLCGWDCDGNDPESPTGAIHLYGDAVQAVRELRQEHAEDLAQAEAERVHLAARVRELIDAGNAAAVIMSAASERIEGLLKERDTLAARVRELEAPGECQSVHVAICPDCGEVETCDEERCCLSCGRDLLVFADRYSAELYRDREMQEHADHLATLNMRIADLHEVLCSDADEATLRSAVSSLVYEARGHGEDR